MFLEINALMHHLSKLSSKFKWDVQHDEAVRKMTELITLEPCPVPTYFEPSKELRLQGEVSKYGLVAALLQELISHASKSLTDSEIDCAQI